MGTGIGLHLCREFVRMHQGSIAIKSQPGVGSTFTVTLPVIPQDHQDIISSPDEGEENEDEKTNPSDALLNEEKITEE